MSETSDIGKSELLRAYVRLDRTIRYFSRHAGTIEPKDFEKLLEIRSHICKAIMEKD